MRKDKFIFKAKMNVFPKNYYENHSNKRFKQKIFIKLLSRKFF